MLYGLRERVDQLGGPRERTRTVNKYLSVSGAGQEERNGFPRQVPEVVRGNFGPARSASNASPNRSANRDRALGTGAAHTLPQGLRHSSRSHNSRARAARPNLPGCNACCSHRTILCFSMRGQSALSRLTGTRPFVSTTYNR